MMYKVIIERALIKRSCKTLFKIEREFSDGATAEDYMNEVLRRYENCEMWHGSQERGLNGYEVTLSPSYHRVIIRIEEVA